MYQIICSVAANNLKGKGRKVEKVKGRFVKEPLHFPPFPPFHLFSISPFSTDIGLSLALRFFALQTKTYDYVYYHCIFTERI